MDSSEDPKNQQREKSPVKSKSQTETRQTKQQRKWFEVTLDSIGDGVITVDVDGKVTRLNPVAEALTGWKNADARGRPLENVFHIKCFSPLWGGEAPGIHSEPFFMRSVSRWTWRRTPWRRAGCCSAMQR